MFRRRRPTPPPPAYQGFPWWDEYKNQLIEHLDDNTAHTGVIQMLAKDFATYLNLTPAETELFLVLSTEWNGTWGELHNAVKRL